MFDRVLVTNFLSVLTVFGDALLVGFVLLNLGQLFYKRFSFFTLILKFLGRYALHFGLIISLLATLGSLYYSDIVGLTPCKLCWYQRILMYPLVPIFSIALLKRYRQIADYILALSGIGGFIALYHYFLQTTKIEILPCSTLGYSVSCSENFFTTFGYITIPMMSLTAFGLIFMLMIALKKHPANT